MFKMDKISLQSFSGDESQVSVREVALVEWLFGVLRVVLLRVQAHLLVETELLQGEREIGDSTSKMVD